ncbi:MULTISPECIES: CCA tRNA nucleotidyltransferase [unclassified Enterococcus]|uniref:CCA tRNA nucleotidyltransferase n=1 Tax=unclassified Enterococcus TaxID=2608891 RepID=UPI0015580A7D|nr:MULTISPECIES: CCA tRNA nucleotidyltransferase [unclassified Enterococcus]MBS7577320.1 CCA tRNA nucleotidyltransferase [Enterococcus sp. MMGLQ5-2]MBS7584587.1 CCA tRNA nucleotidyltransferase [Enterococcus sp. MMGLQ5-1]NPD12442.1 CCA tRNA nucleotidyltransferase [Enterococcus sp. MMGLQ5-1]NPD37154.1 CCA tRNA nucleotidyltransferase [Enterococcus sp. MMGLQ5-2]
MKIEILPQEFQAALPVLNQIQAAGYEAYFVGGSVRDSLLHRPIHDVDIATSATPLEIKKIFSRTVDIGIEHGTILVLHGDIGLEVTTFRTESDYQDFRHPSEVTFVRQLSEDLRRRDFTINALAMTNEGEIIDHFEGISDIEKRMIRAVGNPYERFSEDALRILRAFRFASVLGFSIDSETIAGINATKKLLANISIERIEMEFSKLLVGDFRQAALAQLLKLAIERQFPVDLHKGLLGLEKISAKLDLEEAWTLLAYFNQFDAEKTKEVLKCFKHSNHFVKQIGTLLIGLNERLLADWSIDRIYTYGLEDSIKIESMFKILGFENNYEIIYEIYNKLPIYSKRDLKINGKDLLGLSADRQGKWIGIILNRIEYQVLHGQLINDKTALLAAAKAQLKNEFLVD